MAAAAGRTLVKALGRGSKSTLNAGLGKNLLALTGLEEVVEGVASLMPKSKKNQKSKRKKRSTVSTPKTHGSQLQGINLARPSRSQFGLKEGGFEAYDSREFFASVSVQTTFAASIFRINPDNANLFPVLNLSATRFEMYRIKRLRILALNNGQPTTNAGEIYLAYTPDPMYETQIGQSVAVAKSDIVNRPGSVRAPIWTQQTSMEIPCEGKWKFTRAEATNGLSTNNLGWFIVGSGGAVGAALIDAVDLYVEYEVEFKRQRTEQDNYIATTGLYTIVTTSMLTGVGINLPFTRTPQPLGISSTDGIFFHLPAGNWEVGVIGDVFAVGVPAAPYNYTFQLYNLALSLVRQFRVDMNGTANDQNPMQISGRFFLKTLAPENFKIILIQNSGVTTQIANSTTQTSQITIRPI